MEEELLTSGEVARLLRVHPKHLYRLLRQGLPGHRVGRGHWRFRRAEVLAWFGARGGRAAREAGDIEAVLAPGRSLRAGSNRVLLGRVRSRWVAHAMGDRSSRCADALVNAEALHRAADRVPASPLGRRAALPGNVLVAGCAPAMEMILDRVERGGHPGRTHWLPANSTTSLQLVTDGLVHVAGVHLEDPEAGADHDTLVRTHFGAGRARLVRLLRWRTGLALRASDERRELAELVGPSVRWVSREAGAGTQRVLERVLARLGTGVDSLHTARVATTHREVASAVALGGADVGVAVEAVAREAGLRFVPLAEEGFDLVVPHDIAAERPVARMLEALDDPGLRREIGAVGSYDTSTMGHVTTP